VSDLDALIRSLPKFGMLTLTHSERDGKFQATYRPGYDPGAHDPEAYSIELADTPMAAVEKAVASARRFPSRVSTKPEPKAAAASDLFD
jgi:hypothetical protein